MRSALMFSDKLFEGTETEMVFRTSIRRNVDMEVTINLFHVSESYFRFYQTSGLQQNSRGDVLSQPVLVFNNVANGFGIFKSRNTDQRVIKMRLED